MEILITIAGRKIGKEFSRAAVRTALGITSEVAVFFASDAVIRKIKKTVEKKKRIKENEEKCSRFINEELESLEIVYKDDEEDSLG